jgi:hypothetical protein
MRALLFAAVAVLAAACVEKPEPDRAELLCRNAGHSPGTQAWAACYERAALQAQAERSARVQGILAARAMRPAPMPSLPPVAPMVTCTRIGMQTYCR